MSNHFILSDLLHSVDCTNEFNEIKQNEQVQLISSFTFNDLNFDLVKETPDTHYVFLRSLKYDITRCYLATDFFTYETLQDATNIDICLAAIFSDVSQEKDGFRYPKEKVHPHRDTIYGNKPYPLELEMYCDYINHMQDTKKTNYKIVPILVGDDFGEYWRLNIKHRATGLVVATWIKPEKETLHESGIYYRLIQCAEIAYKEGIAKGKQYARDAVSNLITKTINKAIE